MKDVLIIGYGVVGKNMHQIFKQADIADPHKGYKPKFDHYDVGFVCVPTEMKEDGSCDISIVESVIEQYKDIVDVFCIKSTIPPGTTKELFLSNSVFSPEYFGETIHANGSEYNFVILGGEYPNCKKVAAAYKQVVHSKIRIIFVDSTSAELCKYMENSWIASKVTFCNEFYRIAQQIGVDYNILRELWLQDPRINRSHTFVFDDTPYYQSYCLDKDIPALIEFAKGKGYSPDFMRSVYEVNNKHKHDKS